MSNRSMLEFNHDLTPHTYEEAERWGRSMRDYFASGDPRLLPSGVTWFGMRHHTEPCPIKNPPLGWNNSG